jgi:hypothetical protein
VVRSQFRRALVPGQRLGYYRWHPCCCRCLLKGCEHWFLPRTPRARYCSAECSKAARAWSCWFARRRYRSTLNGKERRREQSRRYRARLQEQPAPPQLPAMTPEAEPAPAMVEVEPPHLTDVSNSPVGCCEGQRSADNPQKSCGLPCHRPGCYVLFAPAFPSLDQKFCSGLCRRALRRVRQREARLRKRRRQGARALRHPRRGPP